jgi:hypothetical protein
MTNQHAPQPVSDLLEQVLESTTASSKAVVSAAERIAKEYADLAPAKRPSYLGIFLIMLSVGIELVHALGRVVISFSEVMLTIMLVSGVVILILSSGLETWLFWVQLRQLDEEQK